MAKLQNYPVKVYRDLKEMLKASTETYGEKTLFMQKENGSYRNISYNRYAADVNALGTELLARGLGGKRIIVTGENCYAWVTAYMAVICGVGVIVPVDKEIPPRRLPTSPRFPRLQRSSIPPNLQQKSRALTLRWSALPSMSCTD